MTARLIFFVSAVSTLATLTTFLVALHGRPLHKFPLPARVLLVLTLLGISLVSGIAWHESVPRTSAETTVEKEPSTVTAADAVAITSTLTTAGLQSDQQLDSVRRRSPQRSPTNRRDEITVDEQSKAIPHVLAAADDALNTLQSQFYIVRGHLRGRQSQPDERLQGLITTDLTLDVTLIDPQGVVHDRFTITSRGGGFTSDASALQARERLRVALQQHLPKEHP